MIQDPLQNDIIESAQELDALYPAPSAASLNKVMTEITTPYAQWILAARFCFLSTVGPHGLDCSPRGDDGSVTLIYNDTTLLLPDWPGNNRRDSLHNILQDPRASLTFMVTHSSNVLRVNGSARISKNPELISHCSKDPQRAPRTVLIFEVEELYIQCGRAIIRSGLWSQPEQSLPSVGTLLQEAQAIPKAEPYDQVLPYRIKDSLF